MCGISCHNNTKFLYTIAEVCLYLMHKKWNSYVYLEPDTTIGNFEVRITTFILTTCPLQIYWTIWICSFHPNSKSISARLGRALCVFFLPVRFWLDNFLVFAATTAAAAAEGWMYFAGVTVRKFTKITTIWVRIIYNFTYPIVSDKHFLWSIFWTNTHSGFFHVACGAQNITLLMWPHWYVARQSDSLRLKAENQLR